MTWNMNKDSKIFVAGHRGLVGSALVRYLCARGYHNILAKSHNLLDLTRRDSVIRFFSEQKPEYVFLAAARVGGVCSNQTHEVDFLLQNLQIQNNVIECSRLFGVKKLLFLGSACVYPRLATEPVCEESLLSGPLEPSNQWYAIAKIAGLKLCQAYRRQHGCDFISCMPCNLYGPGDHYNLITSHVLPSLIRKIGNAKLNGKQDVVCWGDGTPRREFLYSDDCAAACVRLMEDYSDESPVNIGTGSDMTILELAETISEIIGYKGLLLWDETKPNGTPRRLLDITKITSLGWKPRIDLRMGLQLTYADFVAQQLVPSADKIYDNMR
jgi:GDP-L-fucose synthase